MLAKSIRFDWDYGVATIKDVATAAGVAYSTASLAVRGVGKVAPRTRERVLEAARQLGYEPNAAASVLASRRRSSMAPRSRMRLCQLTPVQDKGPRWEAVSERASAFGYDAVARGLDSHDEQNSLSRQLWAQGVDGIVLANFRHSSQLAGFDFRKFAVVKIGRVVPDLWFSCVRVSASEMLMLSLRTVFAYGYRRVACLLASSHSRVDDDMRLGTVFAFQQRHLPSGGALRWFQMGATSAGDSERLRDCRAFLDGFRPDAVIGFTEASYYSLRNAGYSIPGDFGFAACPLSLRLVHTSDQGGREVAGIDSRIVEQGVAAVERIHELIIAGRRGPQEYPGQTVLDPLWLDGRSLPRVRGS